MSREEDVVKKIRDKFKDIADTIKIQRPRRIFLEVSLDDFLGVLEYCVKELNFSHLCTITGLDELEKLGFIYHLAQDSGIMLNIKTKVAKDKPQIKTITGYFPGAAIYERELIDLFGAEVKGLELDIRYPLPDDWPQDEFPLRKDWKKKEPQKETQDA